MDLRPCVLASPAVNARLLGQRHGRMSSPPRVGEEGAPCACTGRYAARRRPAGSRVLARMLALSALFVVSCAGNSKMTFAAAGLASGEGEAVEPEGPPTPPVTEAAPEAVASEVPEGPSLDGTLVRFSADARARRAQLKGGRGFNQEAIRSWRDLVSEVDQYLARPLPQTPLLELVRARVTLEAEWEFDVRHFGGAPSDLSALVLARQARLTSRIGVAKELGLALFRTKVPARLRWPIEQAGISSPFGMRVHPLDGVRRLHAGVDLAGSPHGVVRAAAKGFVVRAGWTGGYGLLVELRHPGDVTTRYGHLSALLCAPGDAVDAGQPIGFVGRTGHTTGPHLHFEVWQGGQPHDPLTWLGVVEGESAKSD